LVESGAVRPYQKQHCTATPTGCEPRPVGRPIAGGSRKHDPLAIRRPLRFHVYSGGIGSDLQQNCPIRCIYDLDAVLGLGLKINCDLLAVGRPRRGSMESTVEGELQETGAIRINRTDLDRRSINKVECNLVPVRRPVTTFAEHRNELKFMRPVGIGYEEMKIFI